MIALQIVIKKDLIYFGFLDDGKLADCAFLHISLIDRPKRTVLQLAVKYF